jgi:hypothetical protein
MRPPDRVDWKIASITGHRVVGSNSKKRIWSAMRALVGNQTIDSIYFGGAGGTDTEALKASLYQRKGVRPWLVVVLPDRLENQPLVTHEFSRMADELIELRNPITNKDRYRSYKIRNEFLVDISSFLLAFFNGNYDSGTGSAIRYAEKKGTKVYKVTVSID